MLLSFPFSFLQTFALFETRRLASDSLLVNHSGLIELLQLFCVGCVFADVIIQFVTFKHTRFWLLLI